MRTDKHSLKRLVSLILAALMLVSLAVTGIGSASALGETKTIYFTSGGYWDKFFALYAWDESYEEGEWFTLTMVSGEDDLYSADIPSEYENVIFCSRSKLAFDWDYVVKKTDPLKIPYGQNHLTLAGETSVVWSKYVQSGNELIYFAPNAEWMNIQYISGHRFILHAFGAEDTAGVWIDMEQVSGDFGAYPAIFAAEVSSKYDVMEFCRVENLVDGTFTVWEKTYSQEKPEDMNMFTQDADCKDGQWSFTEYIEPEVPKESEPEVTPSLPEASTPSEEPSEKKTVFFTANETWKETVSSSIGRISAYAWNSETSEGTWYWLEKSAVAEAEYSVEINALYDSILFGISYSNSPDGTWTETENLAIPEDSNHFTQSEDDETQGTWSSISYDNANYYYVTFIDDDGRFISSQVVREGKAATPPENPSKEADAQFTYSFVGWDEDFSCVTSDITVKALYTKTVNKYEVTFKDFDGEILLIQNIEYGGAATAPEAPLRTGYTFKGWDKDFSDISADITVTAQYTKNVETATKGSLEVEVAGGTSFTISIGGGAARPQGTFYMNTKMPVAATVTLVAKTTNGNEFLGWMNENGLVVSTDVTYSFVTTGNDYLRAVYRTDIEDTALVIFKNDKANQIIDAQHYTAGDVVEIPELPGNSAFIATAWSMTAEEIAAKVALGESVTVTPKWERILIYVNVTVKGGTAAGLTDGRTLRLSAVTVTANEAPSGQKFAYWADESGKALSYSSKFKFYPAEDMTVTAVYVGENETIDYDIILSVNMDTQNDSPDINTVILSWEVPEGSDVTFVQAGALLVDENKYSADTFYKGTPDSNVTKWTPGSTNQKAVNTVTVNKKGVESGSTWIIQGWITYTVGGETVTDYTELVRVTK